MYWEDHPFDDILVLWNHAEDPNIMVREHWHNYYELLFLEEGEVTQTFDNHIALFRKGDVIVIAPKTVHSTFANVPNCRILVIQFRADLCEITLPDCAVQTAQNPRFSSIKALFELLEEEYRQDQPGREQMLRGGLMQLLALLHRLQPAVQTGKGSARQNRIFSYLEEHLEKPLSLREAARALGYTEEHLTTLVRQYSGYSFKQYMDNAKIILAIRLLIFERLPVQEIADRLGYSSASTFARAFRRITGKSPRQYAAGN